ncbi:MAG TPA: hypothetical protein DDY20_11130 [Desulfobulbaceae bacterium]|nr:hypothetical protein [Desulfobulbaceae bacterium]
MYVSQGIKKAGQGRRLLFRLADACRNCVVLRSRNRKAKRGSAVVSQQRVWKLKKLSRGVTCFLLASLTGGALCWLAFLMLARSNVFAVSVLTVQGNMMATEQQVLEKAGLRPGMSLLVLDCKQVEGRVLEHPWVEQATVRRQWPSTVVVQVREREPLALVNIERLGRRQLYYLDSKGEVFAPTTPSRDLDFPVLTGEVVTAQDGTMRIADDSLTRLALDFLNLAAHGNQVLPSQGISEVHVSPEKGVVVYLIDHPFPIYMGKEKMRNRFNLLVRVLTQLYQQDKVKGVAEIRVDYTDDKILVAND